MTISRMGIPPVIVAALASTVSMMGTEHGAAHGRLALRLRLACQGDRACLNRGLVGRSGDTLEDRLLVKAGGGASIAHQMSVTVSDEEYAELTAEAAKSGKPVEVIVHDILAQRLHQRLHPGSPPSHGTTSRTFIEHQYREGKVLALPTREPLTAHEAAERERRALLLAGGTLASDMVIEDLGPR